MRRVFIESIVKRDDGRILIAPSLPPEMDYALIYRTASSVRWDPTSRSLFVLTIDGFDTLDYVRQVIAAVKDEYGDTLILSPSTVFLGLPESRRQEMQCEFRMGEGDENQ